MSATLNLLVLVLFLTCVEIRAEETADPNLEQAPIAEPNSSTRRLSPKQEKRKFVTDHPERSDAGVFHTAFAVGGNFYIEPETTDGRTETGNYFRDPGFQLGAYFDYDYSELDENIPLALRGMVGYKYVLASVHVFSFDGMVRRMFKWSEKVGFGLGAGASAAVWYRFITATSKVEEFLVLPSMILGAGFEFDPFMVDFKWLINAIGENKVTMGFEIYFGLRL